MASNEEQGLVDFDGSKNIPTNTFFNKMGEPVAMIGDIDRWSGLYQKQDDLEKLRLYFTVVSWSLVSKVYPKHEMLEEFQKTITSAEFMSIKLKKFASDIDELSDSMKSMGSVPSYRLLSNEQCPSVIIKSEPAE